MAQSNTRSLKSVDPSLVQAKESTEDAEDTRAAINAEAIKELLAEKYGIEVGLLIFKFPEDGDGDFRTIRFGHFYDSLKMLSDYCKRVKVRIMSDLDGIA